MTSNRRSSTINTIATTTSSNNEEDNVVGTIQLRRRARITWTDDVVDNEGAGKRKSNKC